MLGFSTRVRRVWRLLRSEVGQTTAEYALVLIAAAIIAALLAKWASGGALNDLFDSVISKIKP